MSRFARIEQEVFLRRTELIDEIRKQGYHQTLLLYQLILLHSWGTGKCEKTLPQLCETYSLDYDNSTRRLKILREKRWVEDTDKHIRPLVAQRKGAVEITADDCKNYSKPTVEITVPTVEITADDCKNYSKTDENTVEITVNNQITGEFSDTYGDSNPSLKFKPHISTTTTGEKNGHLSKFSREEILRYLEIRIKSGEDIPTPHKLANWMYQTGEYDVFIRATLYPEKPEPAAVSVPAESSLSGEILEALEILTDMLDGGEDISDMRQWYRAELWDDLMKELEKR